LLLTSPAISGDDRLSPISDFLAELGEWQVTGYTSQSIRKSQRRERVDSAIE